MTDTVLYSITKEAAAAIRRLMEQPGPFPPQDPWDANCVIIELGAETVARIAQFALDGEELSDTIIRLCATLPGGLESPPTLQ